MMMINSLPTNQTVQAAQEADQEAPRSPGYSRQAHIAVRFAGRYSRGVSGQQSGLDPNTCRTLSESVIYPYFALYHQCLL